MDSQTLLVVLVVLVAVAIVLLVALLLRRPETRLERALREEQREGRGELREQLDGLSRQQEARIDGFGRSLTDLTLRQRQVVDTLVARLRELIGRQGMLQPERSAAGRLA